MWGKNSLIFILLACIALPTYLALFHPGFFSMHDDAQVQRTYEVQKAIHDGMFPVRWSQDLGYGYGYPMFNFYAPFIYYLGTVFYSLGFSAIISTKIVFFIGIILSGFGMFLLARKLWREGRRPH